MHSYFFSFRYGACVYRGDYGSQDRDEREVSHSGRSDETKKSIGNVNAASNVSKPQGPLSLREKRKNNEYESPLSRIPGPTRWSQ